MEGTAPESKSGLMDYKQLQFTPVHLQMSETERGGVYRPEE